jgi:hypothetical protein
LGEKGRADGGTAPNATTLLAYWHWSADPEGGEPPC